ncbi:hypothetical protein V1478_000393 [Vespula squamosa]|uniref:Uncharacterized protein n=1 Tax=Vespula squamosa TaxID=30214 RepID=A0ABD2C5D3_VESSQ
MAQVDKGSKRPKCSDKSELVIGSVQQRGQSKIFKKIQFFDSYNLQKEIDYFSRSISKGIQKEKDYITNITLDSEESNDFCNQTISIAQETQQQKAQKP